MLERVRARQRRVWAHIEAEFKRAAVQYYPPDGGAIVLVVLPPAGPDAAAFITELREKHDVNVTPGTFFNMPGCVRIAYLNLAEDETKEGITRFVAFYQKVAIRSAIQEVTLN